MNTTSNKTPKCPLCGANMLLTNAYVNLSETDKKTFLIRCLRCGIMKEADASGLCKKNRLLTLAEVYERSMGNIMLCCETRKSLAWLGEIVVPTAKNANVSDATLANLNIYGYFSDRNGLTVMCTRFPPDEDYGKTWRCWAWKPTPEEMRDTPWES